jgi:hypothetical protein
VADLLLYLLRNSSRVPESMIDTATSFLAAATFTNANGFWFNGVVSESTNLRDWIGGTLQYFLLRQARIGGKEALKPLVPTNSNGTIKTTAVTWVFTFTEEHIIPESFEIIYAPLADRKPFCATVLWRQQDDLGIPVIRNTEVRYTGTAADGPFEQHDLSGFCSSENHAVKVGAYILSKRNHVTHRLQLGVKPDAFNPTLAPGDLVRVRLERVASTGAASLHDFLYEVDRIGKSLSGDVRLDLTHFPVDANLASVVAQEVNAATGSGLIVGTGLSAITCDINSFSDTSVPAETFTSGTFPNYGLSFAGLNESDLGDPPISNPSGNLGVTTPSLTSDGDIDNPKVGDTLTAPEICEGGTGTFYRIDPTVPGGRVIAAQATSTYTMIVDDVDKSVYAEVSCPDPTSPTGYGDPIQIGPTQIIIDPNTFQYVSGIAFSFDFDYQRTFREPTVKLCSDDSVVSGPADYVTDLNANDSGVFGIKYTFSTFSSNIACCSPATSNQVNWVVIEVRNTAGGPWVELSTSKANSGFVCGGGTVYTDGDVIVSGQAVSLKINGVPLSLP